MKLRNVRTNFHTNAHCNGVPPGRLAELLRAYSDDERARIVLRQRKPNACGDGYDILLAHSRADAVRAVAEEREKPGPYVLSLAMPVSP